MQPTPDGRGSIPGVPDSSPTTVPAATPEQLNLSREQAAQRAALVSTRAYEVALDLTGDGPTFASTSRITFDASAGGSTFLDLVAASVSSVTLNGAALEVADVVQGARVRLDGLAERNVVEVVARCAYTTTGEGLHRFVDPVDEQVYLYSQFEVADSRRVFAVFEQPDLKATFAFTVTAPSAWTVVSNSPTPDPVAAGDGASTWTFAPTPVLSSYVTAIVAGPYAAVRGELTSSDGRTIPLGVFARASLAQHLDAEEVMAITRDGFAFYEDWFDRPYPFAKYDQLFVPEFNAGAMENAGCVTFVETYVFRSKPTGAVVERRAETILHELAHMWFGDLVTMRWWDDLWLNESFASYASVHAMAQATRWTSAWTTFAALEKSWAYRQDQLPSTHPIVADMVDLEAVEVNFDGITYAKGASVLKQLVAFVGQDAFTAGLRAYFAAHAWGNTTLDDFLSALEEASGRDLRSWSAVWLEQSGVTTLRPVLTTDETDTITSFSIAQDVPQANPVQRPHRLGIGFYSLAAHSDGSPETLRRVWSTEVDVDGASTEVAAVVGQSQPDLLLVNDGDLAYAKVRLDADSLATAVRHVARITDPLPRSLVLGTAWDMTRDAEMSARDLVDMVLADLAVETEPSVTTTLVRQLATTVSMYVAPGLRPDVAAEVGDELLRLARAAGAGSDAQLQLVKALAARAVSPAQLDAVAALYDGSSPLEGLEVDTDLRWELLVALVAAGRLGVQAVGAELERDGSAAGRRAAATALAAVPTDEAKRTAFDAVVAPAPGAELPNAVAAATIAGFSRVVGEAGLELLEPFVEPYLAAIEGVWRSRSNEIAQQVVTGLAPVALATPSLLGLYDRWLADAPSDLPALVRLVSEDRAGIARALAAQQRDLDR